MFFRVNACVLAVVLAAGVSHAKRYEYPLRASNVVLSDVGSSAYVFSWDFPASLHGVRIDYARLELYVATDAESDNAAYALVFAPVEEFNVGQGTFTVVPGEWSAHVDVSASEARRIVVDVTKVIRLWQSTPGTTRYAALYKHANSDAVDVAIASGQLGANVIAKLTVAGVIP